MEIPSKYIRKIIHIDMDAFYASVEELDNPQLRGKPLAVGGDGHRGVVAAANYSAREYGVKSAMPAGEAYRKCPALNFVKPRFKRYREISLQIRKIFHRYTDFVEPLSLDEAYLDVTENKKSLPSASLIAKEIRESIFQETGLRASAGISINKFLAKIGSDQNKPNGQMTITPEEAIAFMEKLPVEKFFGVGAKTAERMKRSGVLTGADLKKKSLKSLIETYGKSGEHFYNIVRGIQKGAVKTHRERKSFGAENTFGKDLTTLEEAREELRVLANKVAGRLAESKSKGYTVTLKIKFDDFSVRTLSWTSATPTNDAGEILQTALNLLSKVEGDRPVRLLGITLSKTIGGSSGKGHQLTLRF